MTAVSLPAAVLYLTTSMIRVDRCTVRSVIPPPGDGDHRLLHFCHLPINEAKGRGWVPIADRGVDLI